MNHKWDKMKSPQRGRRPPDDRTNLIVGMTAFGIIGLVLMFCTDSMVAQSIGLGFIVLIAVYFATEPGT